MVPIGIRTYFTMIVKTSEPSFSGPNYPWYNALPLPYPCVSLHCRFKNFPMHPDCHDHIYDEKTLQETINRLLKKQ